MTPLIQNPNLLGRERFLVRTSNVLLFCSAFVLAAVHWVFFSKNSPGGFEKIELTARFQGRNMRIARESEALREHLTSHEEARRLTDKERAQLTKIRTNPTVGSLE